MKNIGSTIKYEYKPIVISSMPPIQNNKVSDFWFDNREYHPYRDDIDYIEIDFLIKRYHIHNYCSRREKILFSF